jgi:hypothetical protein
MPNPGSIIGAITEELGETAKQVVKQTVQVPKDVGQTALESLGTPKSGSQSAKAQQKKSATPVDEFSAATDPRTRREMARNALAYLAGRQGQNEPTVWEQKQKEEEQKKEAEQKQKEQMKKDMLPAISTKPKRGNLFGVTKKKAGIETSRNVRQD